MRVALTHVHCWPEVQRGGERIVHELAAALARRGHDVTILSSASAPGTDLVDGVRVVRLRRPPGAGMRMEARFGRRVLPSLLRAGYDIVHSFGPSDGAASVLVSRLGRGHRTVFTNLGIPTRSYWDNRPDHRHHAVVVRHADVYSCLSRHAADMLQVEYGRTAALTPGGVALDRFRPADRRAATPTLLYSGALDEPRKGVATLLQALALLAADEPAVRLWLLGTGDPAGLLEAAPAAARQRTEVLRVADPHHIDWYGKAWATVLPSTHEAFGVALVESLASGTPIVGTTHAALPELVRPGTGTLAQPDDAASLAEACARALALAEEPGIAGRCREAAVPFDWDAGVAPVVEALYAGTAS